MRTNLNLYTVTGWIFFALVFALGVLNIILVHPVPGIVYLLLSLVFLPPLTAFLENKFGFAIPPAVKVLLGIVIVWFTLGISDLTEMYGF